MSRRPFVCGNWKMNTLKRDAIRLAGDIARITDVVRGVDVAVAPPALYLQAVGHRLEDGRVRLAGQDAHPEAQGAFTGEISAPMLRDLGCTYVILGHSERRQLFGETDALVNQKVWAALDAGLEPILCVGETLAQRDAGEALAVVEAQVRAGLERVEGDLLKKVTVAYEPVWAIGTGRTATPAQAQEVHAAIRAVLAELGGREVADWVRIQYGGSVKPDNIQELMAQPDIDGALVGGASLDASAFLRVVQGASPD